MLEKLDLKIDGQIDKNFAYIKQGFPSVITETQDENGKIVEKIDFEKLKQELSDQIIEGKEAYNFTWPGKKKAILEANTPTNKTLRPYREESVNFDTTENLYIEGDNLEVLKLLQNSYFKKVKMIYIDPPYNTGNDFIYNDKFTMDSEEYEEATGLRDEDGDIQFKQNKTSNPRYHSDWCTMMYSRLKLARNLLADDGTIFISIDDREQANLKKICDEIFSGEYGFKSNIIWLKGNAQNDALFFQQNHEYVLCYAKSQSRIQILSNYDQSIFNKIYNEKKCYFFKLEKGGSAAYREDRPSLYYSIKDPDGNEFFPKAPDGKDGRWRKKPETLDSEHIIWQKSNNRLVPYEVVYFAEKENEIKIVKPKSYITDIPSSSGTKELNNLFSRGIFDNPKPVELIKHLLQIASNENDIIMDFFSGSATTAHAVMQLNAEEMGGGTTYFLGKMAA